MNADRLLDLVTRSYKATPDQEASFPVRGSAMGACPRTISMLLAGMEKREFSAKTRRIFEDGHARGAALGAHIAAQWCVDHGNPNLSQLEKEVWTELPVKDEAKVMLESQAWCDENAAEISLRIGKFSLEVRSRCDVVLFEDMKNALDMTEKPRVHLVEIKGKGSWGMKKLPEEGPGDEYLVQIWFQIEGLRAMGAIVESAHFLFENKDTQEWLPWEIDLSAGPPAAYHAAKVHIGSVLDNFATEKRSAEAGTPIHAFGVTGRLPWQCNYCSIGPDRGNCSPGRTLTDKRKAGASVPAWEAT
jgi:hypothetical protein